MNSNSSSALQNRSYNKQQLQQSSISSRLYANQGDKNNNNNQRQSYGKNNHNSNKVQDSSLSRNYYDKVSGKQDKIRINNISRLDEEQSYSNSQNDNNNNDNNRKKSIDIANEDDENDQFSKLNQIEEQMLQIYMVEQIIQNQNNFIQELTQTIDQQQNEYNEEIEGLRNMYLKIENIDEIMDNMASNATLELKSIEEQTVKNMEEQKRINQKKLLEQQKKLILDAQNQKTDTRIEELEQEIQNVQSQINYYNTEYLQNNNEYLRVKNSLESLNFDNQQLKTKIDDSLLIKKQANNQLQETKGNIRVYVRIRPYLKIDGDQKSQMLTVQNESNLIVSVPQDFSKDQNKQVEHRFHFEQIFDQNATQSELFKELQQLIESFVDGFNVCIFAYGQTGSGKTYTIEGKKDDQNFINQNNNEKGILPRSIEFILKQTKVLEDFGWKYDIQMSFQEIYMEQHMDLITNAKITDNNNKNDSQITWIQIEKMDDFFLFYRRAMENRKTASTNANERSSRSHCIFQLKLKGFNEKKNKEINCILTLVDLAGSERLAHSKAEGQQLEETKFINKSLTSLGDVITALCEKQKHIPYRNSKLTYVLSNCFSQESKTLMLLNISPAEMSFQQTKQSLRFGDKVSNTIVQQKIKAMNNEHKQQQQLQCANNSSQLKLQQEQQQQVIQDKNQNDKINSSQIQQGSQNLSKLQIQRQNYQKQIQELKNFLKKPNYTQMELDLLQTNKKEIEKPSLPAQGVQNFDYQQYRTTQLNEYQYESTKIFKQNLDENYKENKTNQNIKNNENQMDIEKEEGEIQNDDNKQASPKIIFNKNFNINENNQ